MLIFDPFPLGWGFKHSHASTQKRRMRWGAQKIMENFGYDKIALGAANLLEKKVFFGFSKIFKFRNKITVDIAFRNSIQVQVIKMDLETGHHRCPLGSYMQVIKMLAAHQDPKVQCFLSKFACYKCNISRPLWNCSLVNNNSFFFKRWTFWSRCASKIIITWIRVPKGQLWCSKTQSQSKAWKWQSENLS